MPQPGFTALEVFLAVAKHQSFRKAAAERGISPSALSHAMRGLEETLSARLFNRTNRSIRLTAAGQHLLNRLDPALREITEAFEQVRGFAGQVAGKLRLNVPRNASELVIEPLMGRFLTTYPEISLEVVTQDGMVDIVRDGFDAGIRAGPQLAKDMIMVPVGPALRFAVVASPAYLTQHGRPRVPQDVHGHACIERRLPSGGRYSWAFARDGHALEIEASGRLVVDDRNLIIAAATGGLGLAHIHRALVAGHIERGELISVLDDWCPALPSFCLYYPGRRQLPAPLRAFIDMARTPPAAG